MLVGMGVAVLGALCWVCVTSEALPFASRQGGQYSHWTGSSWITSVRSPAVRHGLNQTLWYRAPCSCRIDASLCGYGSLLIPPVCPLITADLIRATNENLPPKVIRELARELKSLDESPPEDIRVLVNEDNFSNIYADIEGPYGTPYEGGVFRMKLILNQDFPQTPPKGYFVTRIFHPNIAKNGEICVNTLKKDWKPTLGLRHVLLVVRCLLIEPFPESALNEEAGKMLMEDYEGYSKHARLMTSIHAMKPKQKSKIAIAESTSINAASFGPDTTIHAPLSHNTANKDHTVEGGLGTGSTEAIATFTSPSAKKPKGDLGSARVVLDKKKMDVRKKSLKRL